MRFFRAFNVLIGIIIFGIGAAALSFIIFPCVGLFTPKSQQRAKFASLIHKSWKFFTLFIEKIGCIKLVTADDFTTIRGKIVVASHPSLIDIVLLIGLIPNSVCIAKQALMNNFLLRNIVKNTYIINGIDTEKFLNDAKSVLEEGYNIIIFPTGTRTKPNEEIKIHKGAAQLSIFSGVNIVPIRITCSAPFLQKDSSMLNVCGDTVEYCLKIEPEISPDADFGDDLTEIKLRSRISERIKTSIN